MTVTDLLSLLVAHPRAAHAATRSDDMFAAVVRPISIF
jgi:hypothetical protein